MLTVSVGAVRRSYLRISRARRRRTCSPPQGPPASRPVGGLRTFRDLRSSGIKVRAALHPLSAQPPATSAWWLVSKEEGMRGRKVRSRGPSVICKSRVLACSLSAMRRVRRLMRQRRGSAQSQTPPVLTSIPGSVRACSSKVEFNLAAIPPHLCRDESRQKCSGRPGGSRPGCWRSVYSPSSRCEGHPVGTPCAGGNRPCPAYGLQPHPS
jgi:hypothetical protein